MSLHNIFCIKKRPDSKQVIHYIGLLVFSTFFMMLFSLWTSPFYKNWYGCDASFFTMAGRGIVNGWVPYEDFFDLKGPYFFFIEALGQFIVKGRSGAFILQVLTLFFALVLIIKTCRLFVSAKKTVFFSCIFLFFHIATLWGGNTLEEFMLPLSLLAIYLVLRDLNKDMRISAFTAIIVGACFGIIAFSKITVAVPIVGLVLAVFYFGLRMKVNVSQFEISGLSKSICNESNNKTHNNLDGLGTLEFFIFAFLGFLLSITPIFIYFFSKHALLDMLYSVFIFAFKRSTDFGTPFNITWELKISGCYFALVFAVLQLVPVRKKEDSDCINEAKHKKVKRVPYFKSRGFSRKKELIIEFLLTAIICISIVTALCLHLGDPFIYYFTSVYPVLMLTFIAMFMIYDPFTLFRTYRLDIPLVMFAITLCYFASCSASTLNTVIHDRDNSYYQSYVDAAKEMASLIPDADRDSVYSFNMDMQWFEINKILPYYSYTINLQFFVALDNKIEQNIIKKLESDPPKWIVVGGDLSSYLPNIYDVVKPRYENVYENQFGALYLLQ